MKVEISSVADAGDYPNERLVLKVLTDLDIGKYAVFSSKTAPDGKASSGNNLAYWFPDGAVSAGDLIIIYTKPGAASIKKLADATTARFYYWGVSHPIWDGSRMPVVLEVADWTTRNLSASPA